MAYDDQGLYLELDLIKEPRRSFEWRTMINGSTVPHGLRCMK
jgi:hypothetical protein